VLTPFRTLLHFLNENREILEAISATAGLIGLAFKGWPKLIVRWREQQRRYGLARKVNAQDYTAQDIERAVIYYLDPDCQVVDPSGSEDFRHIYPVRQNLFEVVDDLLNKQTVNKFSLLLADTGMGKTSFLLNYYARHWAETRRLKDFGITLVPLGIGDALAKIENVPNKGDTVLFLDAFDEDTNAIADNKQRFRALVQASSRFRQVLITCRTQFFSRDEEIPTEAGIIKVGPIGPGDTREYAVNKLYLSPFSHEQIRRYLWRRFPFWQRGKRLKALALVDKIEDLPARPMLLAQVESILSLGDECQYSFQIYEQMIQSWLNRETGIAEPVALREFCECLAVDIFQNRKRRAAERITESELAALAIKFGVQLPGVEHIRTRSLLNRDSQGNLKFAHRSIMEYLFVARFRKFPATTPRLEWTDQMKRFFWETSFDAWDRFKSPITFPAEADLSGLEHLRLRPVIALRSEPSVMAEQKPEQLQSLSHESSARVERAPHFYRVAELPALEDHSMSSAPGFYRNSSNGEVVLRLPRGMFANEAVPGFTERLASDLARIVVDHALGLAWEVPGDEHPARPDQANERSRILSTLNLGGFSNWRLPTIEEAFSLAHLSRCEEYRDLFIELGKRIWTADMVGIQRASVNLQTSEIRVEGFSQPYTQWPRAVCVTSTKTG
jgi:hypothetical protein